MGLWPDVYNLWAPGYALVQTDPYKWQKDWTPVPQCTPTPIFECEMMRLESIGTYSSVWEFVSGSTFCHSFLLNQDIAYRSGLPNHTRAGQQENL